STIKLWDPGTRRLRETLQTKGYSFTLEISSSRAREWAPEQRKAPSSLGDVVKSGDLVELVIRRNSTVLRRQSVPLPGGPLHLRARHEGERLSFQVNDLPPLEFHDVFPIGSSEKGAFAVLWPPGAGLGRLRGSRRTTPGEPSLLERGDMLYARGQFAEALLDYQAQAPVASDPKIAQEARCKEGLCLMGLGRYE